ncbi:cation-translocating P-type ATPase C-terminal domain-containing protein, partial [Salmonella enterica subsp. enterica serovar Paratyphi A]
IDYANKVKNTLIFNAFVFQIFNEFKGVTKDLLFMGIVGLTVLLQVIIVMFLGKFAGTVRLSWKLWLVSIAIGFVSWPLAIVGKFIPVPKTPLHEYFMRMWSSIWPGRRRTRRGEANSRQEDGIELK